MIDVDEEQLFALGPQRAASLAIRCARLAIDVRERDDMHGLASRALGLCERILTAEEEAAQIADLELEAVMLKVLRSDDGALRGTPRRSEYPLIAVRAAVNATRFAISYRDDPESMAGVASYTARAIDGAGRAVADAPAIAGVTSEELRRLVATELAVGRNT